MNMRDRVKERLGAKLTRWEEPNARRIYFAVDKKDVLETARVLFRELGMRFSIASGVELPDCFEILYHFSCDATGEFYSVRVLLEDKSNPRVDSIAVLFPGAEWIEREIWELLGIEFTGHPNLKRLLLADDWPQGKYPLRKQQ